MKTTVKTAKAKARKIMGTQRLTPPAVKKELLSEMKDVTVCMMRVLAASKETTEVKEKVANMMVFILNILDIEGEKLVFDKIRAKKSTRTRRVPQKD